MVEETKKDKKFILKSVRNVNDSLRAKLGRLKEKNNKKERKIKKLEEKVENKNRKIESLRKKISRIQDDEGLGKGTPATNRSRKRRDNIHSQKEGPPHSSRVQQPIKDDLTTEVGQAFVEWCRSAEATMVDRHTMFADQVKERLPGAEVDRIFRERNAAGVFFVENAQDAVEYWVVRVKGRDLLLPQPNRSGFREVDQCFNGENIAPDEVKEMYPGELRPKEGKRVLKAKGLIS